MPQTYFTDTPDTEKRFRCRHIMPAGSRCASPCLRGEEFCYFHHTTRRPVPKQELEARKQHREIFALPSPEDRSAIQHAIGEVLRRIASDDIDPRRAGLLLYGLQIASLNLPKQQPDAEPIQPIEEIVLDPDLGILAPRAEIMEEEEEIDPIMRLLSSLGPDPAPELPEHLRNFQAAGSPSARAERNRQRHRTRPYKRTLRTIAAAASSGIVKDTITESTHPDQHGKAANLESNVRLATTRGRPTTR
jgi:hypothetical protein